nr:hypothetical protein [Vibrio sp. Vb0592]
VLSFTSVCSPIFGLVGCLIPAYLVYRVPALHKYKGVSLWVIIVTGLLLCISPLLAFSKGMTRDSFLDKGLNYE